MAYWTVKTESKLSTLLTRWKSRGQGPSSVLVTLLTAAGPTRSANMNFKVLAIQRYLYKRDPWFVNADERRAITKIWRSAFAVGLSAIEEAGRRVGEALIQIYRDHINNGVSRSGPMPGLKPSSIIARGRAGIVGRTPLRRTDELYNSLTFRVERVR